jgi:hypothetical protein
MNYRKIFGVALILAIVVALFIMTAERPKAPKADTHPPPAQSQADKPLLQADPLKRPPPEASAAEKGEWEKKAIKIDKYYEYRTPISFYGLVIDDAGAPIADADVKLTWSDVNGGSSTSTKSDLQGSFSLTGVVGKRLGVDVSKSGYVQYLDRNKNRFSFEYGSYSDENYHVPNAAKPVVFILRKKAEADPLIVRGKQEAQLEIGQKHTFTIGPRGAVLIVERLPDQGENRLRAWSAKISVPGGGLALSTEEFPVEAPENGYAESIEVTNKTPKPIIWQGDNGAAFFVKTPQGYGRVTVRNSIGQSWVYVTSYFNPNPKSRNLEFDPSKVVKPTP